MLKGLDFGKFLKNLILIQERIASLSKGLVNLSDNTEQKVRELKQEVKELHKKHDQELRDLDRRVVRLETLLEFAMSRSRMPSFDDMMKLDHDGGGNKGDK